LKQSKGQKEPWTGAIVLLEHSKGQKEPLTGTKCPFGVFKRTKITGEQSIFGLFEVLKYQMLFPPVEFVIHKFVIINYS
jgi:hypothetical protein